MLVEVGDTDGADLFGGAEDLFEFGPGVGDGDVCEGKVAGLGVMRELVVAAGELDWPVDLL